MRFDFNKNISLKVLIAICLFLNSCKKLVEIDPPAATVTTTQTFSTDDLAIAAMTGVYNSMINANGDNFGNGIITIYCGASSDELEFFLTTISDNTQFQVNNLTATNSRLVNGFWNNGYSIIYAANSVLDGLKNSAHVSDSVKKELTGEAKFVRAFCNFYLCNLFGSIPLVNDINWQNTSKLPRSSTSQVYEQIVNDLRDAQSELSLNYNAGKGERIVPNKWAATALLARVYLYINNWAKAEAESSSIISNSNLFNLNSDLNDVFKINSSEAIWQLQQSNAVWPFNATNEGNRLIPFDAASAPLSYLTNYILNSFDSGDMRKVAWIDSTIVANQTYYYPKKYKVGSAQSQPNGAYTEYYMVLRLAEQYLIRAEARLKQGNVVGAITDINAIRDRAKISLLPNSLTDQQVMDEIENENKTEFFAEWGHRWLDLKRWGKADAVLGMLKGTNWQATDQLYPIPLGELIKAPNLTQNPGY